MRRGYTWDQEICRERLELQLLSGIPYSHNEDKNPVYFQYKIHITVDVWYELCKKNEYYINNYII